MQAYKEWIPLLRKSNVPIELTEFRYMAEFEVYVPWPYYNRAAYLNISAMTAEDDDAIIICLKSNKNESGQEGL